MKVDRITKVVFSAIALLLAVNCARDFSSSSNSSGNSNVLSVERSVAAASPQNAVDNNPAVTYKVVQIESGPRFSQLAEAKLNEMASQGWEFDSDILGALVFKKHR